MSIWHYFEVTSSQLYPDILVSLWSRTPLFNRKRHVRQTPMCWWHWPEAAAEGRSVWQCCRCPCAAPGSAAAGADGWSSSSLAAALHSSSGCWCKQEELADTEEEPATGRTQCSTYGQRDSKQFNYVQYNKTINSGIDVHVYAMFSPAPRTLKQSSSVFDRTPALP